MRAYLCARACVCVCVYAFRIAITRECVERSSCFFAGEAKNGTNYYGSFIGKLNQFAHGIKGRAYAVDDTTIFIKGFSYDGTGPTAYFWIGEGIAPSPLGEIVPYPEDYVGPLVDIFIRTLK